MTVLSIAYILKCECDLKWESKNKKRYPKFILKTENEQSSLTFNPYPQCDINCIFVIGRYAINLLLFNNHRCSWFFI